MRLNERKNTKKNKSLNKLKKSKNLFKWDDYYWDRKKQRNIIINE